MKSLEGMTCGAPKAICDRSSTILRANIAFPASVRSNPEIRPCPDRPDCRERLHLHRLMWERGVGLVWRLFLHRLAVLPLCWRTTCHIVSVLTCAPHLDCKGLDLAHELALTASIAAPSTPMASHRLSARWRLFLRVSRWRERNTRGIG